MLFCADFANIEGRVQAWLSGERWKLDAFRAYDAGTGPDLYRLAYSRAFGGAPDQVTGEERQIGKAMELGLGFGGGIAAFATMSGTYKVPLESLPDVVLPTASDEERERAEWLAGKYMERQARDVPADERMSFGAAVACDVLKQRWRASHLNIVAMWAAMEEGAVSCVRTGGSYRVGNVFFGLRGRFLHMRLPSGRLLAMCRPEIVAGDFKDEQLVFWGVNSETKRWQRKRTYGGDLFQSAVQATARDILAAAMLRVEAAGYLPVMSVHDEVVSEARAGSLAEFERLMVGPAPGWASGLPIAVEGWSGTRYRK